MFGAGFKVMCEGGMWSFDLSFIVLFNSVCTEKEKVTRKPMIENLTRQQNHSLSNHTMFFFPTLTFYTTATQFSNDTRTKQNKPPSPIIRIITSVAPVPLLIVISCLSDLRVSWSVLDDVTDLNEMISKIYVESINMK